MRGAGEAGAHRTEVTHHSSVHDFAHSQLPQNSVCFCGCMLLVVKLTGEHLNQVLTILHPVLYNFAHSQLRRNSACFCGCMLLVAKLTGEHLNLVLTILHPVCHEGDSRANCVSSATAKVEEVIASTLNCREDEEGNSRPGR